jgi:hypothetical protein
MFERDETFDDRFREQLKVLNTELPRGERALAGPEGAEKEGAVVRPAFAYLDRHILVRREDQERAVRVITDALPGEEVRPTWPPRHELHRVSIRRLLIGGRGVFPVVELLAGAGIHATPVHFISITADAGGNLCPGDEPVPSSGPLNPPLAPHDGGRGVRVVVIDTGLTHDYLDHQWLAASSGTRPIPQVDGEVTTRNSELGPDGCIRPYVGHGTFVAGVLRCVAPAAEVYVAHAFPYAGSHKEDEFGLRVRDILHKRPCWPDIISLSAGTRVTHTAKDDHDALLGLADFVGELAAHPQTLLVAAAGNDGVKDRFWPAALAGREHPGTGDMVLSVGALRQDGRGRACFTNHGDWVKIYTPGERLTNAFMGGTYKYTYPHRTTCRFYPKTPLYRDCSCIAPYTAPDTAEFDGTATWSGTSFATPYAAALVAAHMSAFQESSRTTAGKLVGERLGVPDLSGFLS